MNIVFDWSGTLADDHIITWDITNQVLEYFGGEAITFDTYKIEFVINIVYLLVGIKIYKILNVIH